MHEPEAIVVLPLEYIGPSDSYCEAAGRRKYYTLYRLPAQVSRALGVGCSGDTYGWLDGVPYVSCRGVDGAGHPIGVCVGERTRWT